MRDRTRPFSENGWTRKSLIPCDEGWHALSPEARRLFLDASSTGGVPHDRFQGLVRPQALQELENRGFVLVSPQFDRTTGLRVVPSPKARDFTLRMRAITDSRLLTAQQPTGLLSYVRTAYYAVEGTERLSEVLHKAGIDFTRSLDQIVSRWVTRRYRPEWAGAFVKSPLKKRLLGVIREAGGPLPLAALAGKLHYAKPEEVRGAIDELVAYLILFEDLQPQTLDLVIDILPVVRAALDANAQPAERTPLVRCEQPEEVAPEGGTIVNDLRAFLLEVASEPPRLKQDASLFAKELTRFGEILEPYPDWLHRDPLEPHDSRLNAAVKLARRLNFVRNSAEQGEFRMHLTTEGQQWLGGTLEAQYVSVYRPFNDRSRVDAWSTLYGSADSAFLGAEISVGARPDTKTRPNLWGYMNPTQSDVLALRDAFFHAFESLPLGVYHRLDSLLDHFSADANSPFNLGRPPGSVWIAWGGRLIPDFPEEREEVGRRALEQFIRERLVPLGALALARASGNVPCVARTPLLAAYFGRPGLKLDEPAPAAGATRVVVQPDFSVIIIGPDSAPAVALAPFCERAVRQPGSGALVLKLSRESVLKAVSVGLPATEILARLEQHASTGLPPNVARQVRDWGAWARSVDVATLTIVRCDDRATADRVLSALGKRAERLSDTVVALAANRLTTAERTKLQSQGVLIRSEEAAARRKPKPKGKRKGYGDDW